MGTGPLDGYRVIEMCQIVSGPLACMILADQGADVIKVESGAGGDLLRLGAVSFGGFSGIFANCNRGKRSVVIDVTTDAGRDVVLELFKTADVVVQNFRPGAVAKLGIGHEAALAVNPDVVYVSISGYGQTGPYAKRKVYDPVMQGITGFVASQVNPEIPFPDVIRTLVCDKATSLTVAQAVTAALLARERGRARGQHIEVSMLDAGLSFFWPDGMMGHTVIADTDAPNRPALAQSVSVTTTADGHLMYFANTQDDLFGLFRSLGLDELCADPRFATLAERMKHAGDLGGILAKAFEQWPTTEILDRLISNQVAAGPVNSLEEVLRDPQVVHAGTVWEWEHATSGMIRQTRPPARFGGTPSEPHPHVPALGEHTHEVLSALGFDDAKLDQLGASGVVGV